MKKLSELFNKIGHWWFFNKIDVYVILVFWVLLAITVVWYGYYMAMVAETLGV